jgi:hypothetical protein
MEGEKRTSDLITKRLQSGILQKMLENDEIDEDIAEASASIAEAYLRMDSIPEVCLC